MRRLQSFKTPSRLSEKLKFSNKANGNNDIKTNNGIKFVPNISKSDSNETKDNSSRTNGISSKNINFVEKLESEKLEQSDDAKKLDKSLINIVHRGKATNKLEKQNSIHDYNRTSVNLAVNGLTADIYKDNAKFKLDETSKKLEGWSVFQLPKYMPENEKNMCEFSKIPIPTLLHDNPSGSIGKLVFRRNGDIDLSLNSSKNNEYISFKLDCISRDNSEQFITALSKINELINLGKCDSLLIATPKI